MNNNKITSETLLAVTVLVVLWVMGSFASQPVTAAYQETPTRTQLEMCHDALTSCKATVESAYPTMTVQQMNVDAYATEAWKSARVSDAKSTVISYLLATGTSEALDREAIWREYVKCAISYVPRTPCP